MAFLALTFALAPLSGALAQDHKRYSAKLISPKPGEVLVPGNKAGDIGANSDCRFVATKEQGRADIGKAVTGLLSDDQTEIAAGDLANRGRTGDVLKVALQLP